MRIGTESTVYDSVRVRFSNGGYTAVMNRDGLSAMVVGDPGHEGDHSTTGSTRAANVAWLARVRWARKHLGELAEGDPHWSEDRDNFVTLVTDEGPGKGYLVTFLLRSDVEEALR